MKSRKDAKDREKGVIDIVHPYEIKPDNSEETPIIEEELSNEREDDKTTDPDRRLLLQTFADLVDVMLPLAKHLNSSNITSQERAKLRELTGKDGIFKLSNLLNRLCSETARRNL